MSTTAKQHIGRKISRIRELRGMKQDALAQAMGVSQQTVSNIENSAEIDSSKLEQVAKALGVLPEAIENFSEESVINLINNFHDHSQGSHFVNNHCTFNPLDKLVEAYEENKKLYERLIVVEREKAEAWERLARNKE